MKRSLRWGVGVLALGLLGAGCTPSPEKVCNHLREISPGASSDPSRTARCVANYTALRSANSGAYRTMAKCIMDARDPFAALACQLGAGRR